MPAKYDDSKLRASIEKVKELSHKSDETVLREVSLSIAQKLVSFTPPKNKAQGTKAMLGDIDKVYISENKLINWSEANEGNKTAKRINDLIKRQDFDALTDVFRNSPRLNTVEVSSFSESLIENQRNSRGRINLKKPKYFFIGDGINEYIKQKKKLIGYAKSAFAAMVSYFGGRVPQWIGRYANNEIIDKSKASLVPSITMTSNVGFIASLAERTGLLQRAVNGAASSMVKRAKYLLKEAKEKAGF